MAVDIFLKINGIDGESKDDKHAKEIDVLAWSWGLSNTTSFHTGGGGGAGKVAVQDLSITKYIDKASSKLMLACCTGEHIKDATLVVRKAGSTPLEYLTIKLTDLMVSHITTGGSGGEDRLTENITLSFSKVNYSYQPQSATGGKDGGALEAGWDVSANKKV